MTKYYPTSRKRWCSSEVTGINPKSGKKETYTFSGLSGKTGFDRAEKKQKQLQTQGYKKVTHGMAI